MFTEVLTEQVHPSLQLTALWLWVLANTLLAGGCYYQLEMVDSRISWNRGLSISYFLWFSQLSEKNFKLCFLQFTSIKHWKSWRGWKAEPWLQVKYKKFHGAYQFLFAPDSFSIPLSTDLLWSNYVMPSWLEIIFISLDSHPCPCRAVL